MPIYNVLLNMHHDLIPIPEHLIFWSEIFASWYEGTDCDQIISISNIIDYIDDNTRELLKMAIKKFNVQAQKDFKEGIND